MISTIAEEQSYGRITDNIMKRLALDSEIFTRAVETIVTPDSLENLLNQGKRLRIKHGIDVTSPDLHLGHAASLWKLRSLQEAGHCAVVLLGDVTTQIGDPTGRSRKRPVLSPNQIRKNAKAIERQVRAILLASPRLLEVRRSSEWYARMKTPQVLKVLSMVTHARLIERDMFQERMRAGEEIAISELIYPVLQGYDSVMLRSDMTVIGSDQLFNEHVGRMLQEKFGQPPQVIVALSLLPGLEGREKMSKSLGNYIGINDAPQDKFGKAMRVVDSLITKYLEAYTDVPMREVKKIEDELKTRGNPMQAKLFLAESLVRRYHGARIGEYQRTQFLKTFSEGKTPERIPEKILRPGSWDPVALLLALGLAPSKSAARRLISQGGVDIDGRRIESLVGEVEIREGTVIRAGKRTFLKIKIS